MKINTKLNIILFLFFLMFLYSYWLYLQANSMLTIAQVMLDKLYMVGKALYGR